MRLRFKTTSIFVLAFVLHAAAARPGAAQQRPPAAVTGRLVEGRAVQQRERVIGSLRAASEAVLAALEEGAVTSFTVREGHVVRTGDTLLVIDTRRLEAQRTAIVASRAEADAVHVQREAELSDARDDFAALEAAAKSDAISERDLRRARTALAVAEAQLTSAARRAEALVAELALLDVRIHDATLRAPFDGVVVERHVEIGEWVQAGDPAVTLISSSALEVWLDVPERLLGQYTTGAGKLGDELMVEIGPERRPHRALAPRIVPRVDPRSRTFALVALLAGDAHEALGLSPGVSASAWLSIGRTDEALLVPKDALVYRPGGVSVMAVMGEGAKDSPTVTGTAALIPVVIRFEADREVAIEPGALQVGTLVVTEGNERLFPGTAVLATVDRTPLAR
jgi:RND family efflux transporter MFP subunit